MLRPSGFKIPYGRDAGAVCHRLKKEERLGKKFGYNYGYE
jgi:hypothetical protein